MAVTLNEHILAVCATLPRGGGYLWPVKDDPAAGGCLAPIVHRGVTILRPSRTEPVRTYCCGLTLEVLWRAWARAGYDPPLDADQARELRRLWFGAKDNERGPVDALLPYRLGVDVSDNPRPGDFVQFWRRNGSGHSAVVLGWDGINLRYFSTQRSTDGIGERVERVDPRRMFAARALTPNVCEAAP